MSEESTHKSIMSDIIFLIFCSTFSIKYYVLFLLLVFVYLFIICEAKNLIISKTLFPKDMV